MFCAFYHNKKNGGNYGRELQKRTQVPCGQLIPKSKGGRVWPQCTASWSTHCSGQPSAPCTQREAGNREANKQMGLLVPPVEEGTRNGEVSLLPPPN